MDLDAELDGLYEAPLADFVRRRNDLAKRLRAGGDKTAAERVKALSKPSITAWAVNQLAFHAAAELEALMAAGARVREAHLATAREQRQAAGERRDAVSTLVGIAERLLTEAGQKPGRVHRQRISRTLEALSSRGSENAGPPAGRLGEDLEAAGFDAIADLAAALEQAQAKRAEKPRKPPAERPPEIAAERPKKGRKEPGPDAETRRREAARRLLDRQLEEAREAASRLGEKIAELEREAGRAGSQLGEARAAAEELSRSALEAERRARQARERADAAAETAQRARFAAEAAAAALARAEKERAGLLGQAESLTKERDRL